MTDTGIEVYEGPQEEKAYLKLERMSNKALIKIVDDQGEDLVGGNLLVLSDKGAKSIPSVRTSVAVRAGFSPEAFDREGRLIMEGQAQDGRPSKTWEDKPFNGAGGTEAQYRCDVNRRDSFSVWRSSVGSSPCLYLTTEQDGKEASVRLSLESLRDLHSRLSHHLAEFD